MPKPVNSAQLIKDNAVIDNQWPRLEHTDTPEAVAVPEGQVMVPLNVWQAQHASLSKRRDIGVWLANDTDLAEVSASLQDLPIIAIDFPAFMDGRGFSLARLLRERYQYAGELRAIGNVIRDQLCYLKRCGFNSFELAEDVELTAALASLNDFTESYQTSVDQPIPLFRRKQA